MKLHNFLNKKEKKGKKLCVLTFTSKKPFSIGWRNISYKRKARETTEFALHPIILRVCACFIKCNILPSTITIGYLTSTIVVLSYLFVIWKQFLITLSYLVWSISKKRDQKYSVNTKKKKKISIKNHDPI